MKSRHSSILREHLAQSGETGNYNLCATPETSSITSVRLIPRLALSLMSIARPAYEQVVVWVCTPDHSKSVGVLLLVKRSVQVSHLLS